MASAPGLYFGGSKALCKADSVQFASVHGWEVIPSFQHEEEYAQDSTFREAVARHHFKVDINLKYSKFDPTITTWLASKFLAGADGAVDGTVEDSSEIFSFDFVGWMEPVAGSTDAPDLMITVEDCYFESFPIAVPENKFVVSDLKAHGSLITFSNTIA